MDTYSLHIYDTSGVKQFVITDYRYLTYTRRVNDADAIKFAVAGDAPLAADIKDKWEVQVRKNGASETVGLFRDEEWSQEEGESVFDAFCLGPEHKLAWRTVNWIAGSTNRSSFNQIEAETVAKKLVEFNAASAATAENGRKRDGAITGISVATDASGGDPINWNCHGDNLLETLQGIADIGGGDFSLSRISAGTYSFAWHTSQLGTDKTSDVTFSVDFGNMYEPSYSLTRSDEATVATVWGQGEGASRNYVTRTGDNFASDNDIEVYVDAKDVGLDNTSGLNARGDAKLDGARAKENFSFKATSTEGVQYGDDFGLGDLVKAINPFTGASTQVKVEQITVSLDPDGNEETELILRTP